MESDVLPKSPNTHQFPTTKLCLRSNKTNCKRKARVWVEFWYLCLDIQARKWKEERTSASAFCASTLVLEEQAKETRSGLTSNSPFVRHSQEYQKDTRKALKLHSSERQHQRQTVSRSCSYQQRVVRACSWSQQEWDQTADSLHFFRQLTGVMRSMQKYHKSSQETKMKKSSHTDSTLHSR